MYYTAGFVSFSIDAAKLITIKRVFAYVTPLLHRDQDRTQ
jgi:hypothetical protein